MKNIIYIMLISLLCVYSCTSKPEPMPEITENNSTKYSFEEFSKTLKTGDIILFHGDNSFNKGVSFLEGGNPWGHVGMVVNTPEMKRPLFWESTIKEKVKDLISDSAKDGPMLDYLEDRLKNDIIAGDNCNWALRRLNVPDSLRPQMHDSLIATIKAVHDKQIPGGIPVAWDAVVGKYFGIKASYKKIYCTELMALTFENMGLWKTDKPLNFFDPADFSNVGTLPFISGVSLDKEVAFKPIIQKDSTLTIWVEKQ